jgi:protoporphyrinogen oxidase
MTGPKRILIGGAGPAGLTTALELARSGAGHEVIVVEASREIGGISRTVNYKGNRIDIGGHRFFSKSDWVMNWWTDILPLEESGRAEEPDQVMLVRRRLSRIYYRGKFFAYPVRADLATGAKLGPWRVSRMLASYGFARLFPRPQENSLEDFLLNRFGRELYETFFKDYTEKVWGVPCGEISAEWGAQRIKGLSISRAATHALRSLLPASMQTQGKVNTSLIERFYYPKFGPGQLWETVVARLAEHGIAVQLGRKVAGLVQEDGRIAAAILEDVASGTRETLPIDAFVSTLPVKDLVEGLTPAAPAPVRSVAAGLQYRDFITVGLLLRRLQRTTGSEPGSATNLVPDNWIYVQDKGVQVGRLQIFNNWSPHMVADPDTAWVGLEYFCAEGDALWTRSDAAMAALAMGELARVGLADPKDLLDSVVIRVPKAYPGYFGRYRDFGVVRSYLDAIPNLFLIGRNGMHRYNNQDHSMLTGRLAAEAILEGSPDKAPLWAVNIDDEYHEEKRS